MKASQVGIALIGAMVGLVFAGTAWAATQGTLGSTSQGTLNITATIQPLAQISELDDINLGTFAGTGGLSGSDNICVFSNTGGYDVTATGSGTSGAFTLAGVADTISYAVEWATTSGATSGTAMTSGTALTGQTGTFTTPDCNGGVDVNATVLVSVSDTVLGPAAADTYTGVLTLLVAPQ